MTRLDIPVTYNFRPVVGTAPGTLFRADALARLSGQGRARLRALGVRRVIDLRSDMDRRLGGRDRVRGVGTDLVRVPMFSGGRRSQVQGLTLESLYRDLLDGEGAALGAAIRAVADAPPGAVVIHCTAGKDRTGVSAALLQLALGVDPHRVVDDYARTQAYLEGEWADRMRRRVRRLRVELTPQLDRILVGSPPEVMEATLDRLQDVHGGPDAYLAKVGVTDAYRERLVERLGGAAAEP